MEIFRGLASVFLTLIVGLTIMTNCWRPMKERSNAMADEFGNHGQIIFLGMLFNAGTNSIEWYIRTAQTDRLV